MRITVLFLIITVAHFITASHFRYGSISWSPVSYTQTQAVIQFTATWAWRKSYSSSTYCDASTIAAGTLMGILGNIYCDIGCFTANEVIGDTEMYCTSFSVTNDWAMGQRTWTHTVPIASDIEASFIGNAWVTLVAGVKYFKLNVIKI